MSFYTCFCFHSYRQSDSLVLKNNNVMIGEIKSMNNGVLTIETDYSKNDFTVKWLRIKRIYSKTNFMISLENGQRISGAIHSGEIENLIIITLIDGEKISTTLDKIVYLKSLKSNFWSRTHGSIDFGLNITKANNLREYSVRSGIGYQGIKWQADVTYDDIRSKQDSVDVTKRTESGLLVKYFLPKDWFLGVSLTFLSNTQQALKLRTTGQGGAGNFLVHTNKFYWGLGGGLSINNESFTNEKEGRQSLEGFAASELNLFDIGDLSLKNNISVYRSITESGRWRVDFSLNSKYDLPLDLYLRMGLTMNYDNRPAIIGNETDYILSFSIGWELNK